MMCYTHVSLYWLCKYLSSWKTLPPLLYQSKSWTSFMGTFLSFSLWVVPEIITHCDLPFLNAYRSWSCTNPSTTWLHVTLYCSLVLCIDFKLFLECLLLNCKCLQVSGTQQLLKKILSDSRRIKHVENLKNGFNQLRFWWTE